MCWTICRQRPWWPVLSLCWHICSQCLLVTCWQSSCSIWGVYLVLFKAIPSSLFNSCFSGCMWWLRWGTKPTMYVTIPRNDLSCCLSVGAISSMPWILQGSGCTPYMAPKNDTLSWCNSSFFEFSMSPSSWQTLRKLARLASWSSLLIPKMITSSFMPMTLGHFSRMRLPCEIHLGSFSYQMAFSCIRVSHGCVCWRLSVFSIPDRCQIRRPCEYLPS